jgi:hypothetical protein
MRYVSNDSTTPTSSGVDKPQKEVSEQRPLWPIGLALAAAFVLSIAVAVAAWFALGLLLVNGHRGPAATLDTRAQLELLKLTFAVVAGVGGIVALVTAYRRQRTAERSQAHAERSQLNAEHDATERRITDLYGQAAEQLGHNKAAVRLAGLYALERLAHDHHRHRQAVVDVVCAYLRMPFHDPDTDTTQTQPNPPDDSTASETEPTPRPHTSAEEQQEKQVRLTAQRLLIRHLHIGPDHGNDRPFPETYWDGINIDLTDAHLIDFDFSHCRPHNADFTHAAFTNTARFGGAQFSGDARFGGAQFCGEAWFDEAQFSGNARFDRTRFDQGLSFDKATASHPNDAHVWPDSWHIERALAASENMGQLTRGRGPEMDGKDGPATDTDTN